MCLFFSLLVVSLFESKGGPEGHKIFQNETIGHALDITLVRERYAMRFFDCIH
jgi:hypothetical protein